jgi:hypothetical protein
VDGTDALDKSPVCFVLPDQCFPSLIPVEGDRECIKVLRIEDGSLLELADVFLGLTRGFTVPAGSVVVLSSASYLALVGTATYAKDFAGTWWAPWGAALSWFMESPSFILLSGTEDSALIRSMADMLHQLGHI